jgi:putative MATE family efflux protein
MPPLLDDAGTLRPMLKLALPVLAEQSLAMLVGLADTWLTGNHLGPHHLAAMNLMAYILWLLPTLFSTVGIGATAMIARFIGAGDRPMANRIANQAYVLGVGLAVVVTGLGLAGGQRLVTVMQLEGEAARLAWEYLRVVLPAAPFVMLEVVGIACLRGAGKMAVGLAAMAITNAVNVGVGASLLLGWGPFPRLGWQGLAVGTAAGYVVGGLVVAGVLVWGGTGLALRRRHLRPNRDLMRRLLRIGLPGGVDMLAVNLCHLWFVGIVNQLGVVAAAAHGVAIRIESLAYLPGAAFQVAATTLAGQYLGAGDRRRASRSVWTACLVGGGIMVAAGALFFFAAEPLTRTFVRSEQQDVVATAAPLLRIVAFGMPALALTSILSGGLRGAGDTRWTLVITFVGLVGVRIPAAYLLAHSWGLGVRGAWFAMVTDLTVRCVLVALRFRHGGWQRIEV